MRANFKLSESFILAVGGPNSKALDSNCMKQELVKMQDSEPMKYDPGQKSEKLVELIQRVIRSHVKMMQLDLLSFPTKRYHGARLIAVIRTN